VDPPPGKDTFGKEVIIGFATERKGRHQKKEGKQRKKHPMPKKRKKVNREKRSSSGASLITGLVGTKGKTGWKRKNPPGRKESSCQRKVEVAISREKVAA